MEPSADCKLIWYFLFFSENCWILMCLVIDSLTWLTLYECVWEFFGSKMDFFVADVLTARGIGETEKNTSFPIFHTRHNFIKVLHFNNTQNSLTWNWDSLFQSSSNPICHQVLHPNSYHCGQMPTFPRTSASQIPWVSQVGGGGAS